MALGIVYGGTSSLLGPTAISLAKYMLAKCGSTMAAAKLGIAVGLSFPVGWALVAIAGGVSYLLYNYLE